MTLLLKDANNYSFNCKSVILSHGLSYTSMLLRILGTDYPVLLQWIKPSGSKVNITLLKSLGLILIYSGKVIKYIDNSEGKAFRHLTCNARNHEFLIS